MSDQSLYVAMTGAKQTMLAQTANANNLANINTTGFRADRYNAFSVALDDAANSDSVYTVPDKTLTDFTPGTITQTGRDLDVAIEGQGFIAVQDKDGKEAYTRAGHLQMNANGVLQTSNGYTVLGNGGPISIPPFEHMDIAKDGSINIKPLGETGAGLATLDRIKLVKPEVANLSKGLDGLFRLNDGTTALPDPNVKVISNALESSNVNSVEAMVNMISLARQFEAQVKFIHESDSQKQMLAQLLQL